ncbi:alpha/beta hydrolase [Alteromonas oceanisediminis]|uniref:alpha/beta hydrolase n=1 Tax=Alteromonas oceanisediminis TaxID=2836180 RepID=UPI001BDA0D41|nr:alpha/beta fold hydrolase [Alteromonas oceanisediminis]MBT0585512.1 alpha/beta fold hydrolase [Alteromonas oceanisediminis]
MIKQVVIIALLSSAFFSPQLQAEMTSGNGASTFSEALHAFTQHYRKQLGLTQRCLQQQRNEVSVCSANLRNDGNAPFILHHATPSEAVVVLFHGLSDSPFYLRSVATALHQSGHTVVVGLLPGHGLIQADADMQDTRLSERWKSEFKAVTQLARPLGRTLVVGGFSSGATLATHYALSQPDEVDALLLFSGALALSDNAEKMSRIWGMQTVAKWIDGDYQSNGPNPFKYPDISLFAALELMEVIRETRALMRTKGVNVKLFAAHSMSDETTPFHGVESLLEENQSTNTTFLIDDSFEVCHGNLALDRQQVAEIQFDVALLEVIELCVVPEANPLHRQMMFMLNEFMRSDVLGENTR